MPEAARIVPLRADHLLTLDIQPRQRMQLGRDARFSPEEAEHTVAAGEGWAVLEGGRVAAAYGLAETYPGRHAIAWAMFGTGLNGVHLALSRHARARIAASTLRRIEAVALCDQAAMTLDEALARPTPEMRWATMVGLRPHCLLRQFGGASETLVYYERIAA